MSYTWVLIRGFVRLDRKFMEAKKTNLLYYSGDTHWADRGAVIVSSIILERLSLTDSGLSFPIVRYKKSEATHNMAKMFALLLSEIDELWTRRLPLSKKIDTAYLRASKIVIIEVVERNLDKVKINKKALLWALGGGRRYKRGMGKL